MWSQSGTKVRRSAIEINKMLGARIFRGGEIRVLLRAGRFEPRRNQLGWDEMGWVEVSSTSAQLSEEQQSMVRIATALREKISWGWEQTSSQQRLRLQKKRESFRLFRGPNTARVQTKQTSKRARAALEHRSSSDPHYAR